MSYEVTTAFRREYTDAFMITYQQMMGFLKPTVRNETQSGEEKFWDFVGRTSAIKDRARGSKTQHISTPHSRRRNTLHSYTWSDTTSDLDKIQMMKDPNSDYLKVGVAALHRGMDEEILAAMGGPVYTGKGGTTVVQNYEVGECRLMDGDGTVVDAGSDHSDTTETALTVAKIATMGDLLDDASVPMEGRYITANPYQKWQLLQDTKIGSSDYNRIKALYAGEISDFMGFQFVFMPTERFTVNATDTSCIECYAWQRDAMLFATAKDIMTRTDPLPDENYDVQVFAEAFYGATRLQGAGVIEVLLKTSA
jgi:hypothetical protein